MLGFKGPAQPSPTLGDALNAGYGYLEVRCLGCDTNQTVALDIVRRPKATPVHELERYMRCKDCSRFAAIRTSAAIWSRCAPTKISASDPPSYVVAGRAVNEDEGATMNGSRYYVVRSEGTKYGIGFGSALAIAISYTTNKSILWAIIHGILGWLYVIYFALFQS